jgi:hypothetical protein
MAIKSRKIKKSKYGEASILHEVEVLIAVRHGQKDGLYSAAEQ